MKKKESCKLVVWLFERKREEYGIIYDFLDTMSDDEFNKISVLMVSPEVEIVFQNWAEHYRIKRDNTEHNFVRINSFLFRIL